jgi:hypothetical protein
MLYRACLSRYVLAFLIAYKLAQACATSLLSGDIPKAYQHAFNFAQVWECLLNTVGRTNR